jgi:hypothetical protein
VTRTLWRKHSPALRAMVWAALRSSRCLHPSGRRLETNHDHYLKLLRVGGRHGHAFVSALSSCAQATASVHEARAHAESGAIVTEVDAIDEVDDVPLWLQGDEALATEEKMAQRRELRFDPRVRAALQRFWEAAQRSLQSGGDASADTLHREGHSLMLRRVYRLMIEGFGEGGDEERTIGADWEADTKGAGCLNRARFCDALFELADTWTLGISGAEYAAWLSALFSQIATAVEEVDEEGHVRTVYYVWKEERDVTCAARPRTPNARLTHAHTHAHTRTPTLTPSTHTRTAHSGETRALMRALLPSTLRRDPCSHACPAAL